MSTTDAFDTLLWVALSDREEARLPELVDGRYYLRIRGIDELGLEGLDGSVAIDVNVHPEAPVATGPVDGAVLYSEPVTLTWTEPPEAVAYRLEVARDDAFVDPLFVENGLPGARFDAGKLPGHGRYYWRLTSLDGRGEPGPTGATRHFDLRPPHPRLYPILAPVGDGRVRASWSPGPAGLSYQVQVASDDRFRAVLRNEVIDTPAFTFVASKRESRYLRVRSIAADGDAGPWSPVEPVAPLNQKRALLISFLTFLTLVGL